MPKIMENDNDIQALLLKHGIEDPECGAYCGNGWVPHIEELIVKLIALGWDKDLKQIKEKFGGLCFYVGKASAPIHELIQNYEKEASVMCEACGKPGRIAPHKHWYVCLCTECAKIVDKDK